MVGSVAGDLPEQVKNNQSVNLAAGTGGQKMSQYSWFTVYTVTTGAHSYNGTICVSYGNSYPLSSFGGPEKFHYIIMNLRF